MQRFSDMVDRALRILERRGRVSMVALRLDLGVDESLAAAIRDELVDVLEVAEELSSGVLALRGGRSTSREEVAQSSPERRQITVLFCDLVSSTASAESLDPEVLSEVMARYQGICSEVINRFEGHVSQWSGDGVDVYFGFPRAHEDDATRAVHCGLAIVDAIAGERASILGEFGVSLAVRIGVNTGTAVVGGTALDSRGGTLAFGDTPNIAARIQALAAPGTVAIGERTYRLVAAVRSTLTSELKFEFVECQCSPLRSDSALHPIAEGVRRFLNLGPADAEQRLRSVAGDERAVALLALALGVPVPAGVPAIDGPSPQRLRRETLEALASFFLDAAERSPLALVIEDLHWVDPSSAELLGKLIEGRVGSRLLVLLTARPGFSSPWSDLVETQEVGRLPAQATLQLIEAASGGAVSGDVARRMADRADGIPLFAEELTRAVVDASTSDEEEVPTTLYGCLMARLDRDPRARSVAQLAAIVGREFELPLIESAGELDPATLHEGLERLIEDQLVTRAGEDRFAFKPRVDRRRGSGVAAP